MKKFRNVNQMTRKQMKNEYARNSERQSQLTELLITLGYGRVWSHNLHQLVNVPEAIEADILMSRQLNLSMEIESVDLGYRTSTVAA